MGCPSAHRYIVLTLTFFERALFVGAIFSWPSLVYVLQEDGVYSHLCTRNGNESLSTNGSNINFNVCDQQKVRLSLGTTIAVVSGGLGSIPFGWIMDRWGLRITQTIALSFGVMSFISFAATNKGRDWLIFPGSIFMGAAFFILSTTHSHVARMARSKTSMVIALYHVAVHLSITFQCVKISYDHGIPKEYSLGVLAAVWSLFIITAWFILPRYKVDVKNEEVLSSDVKVVNYDTELDLPKEAHGMSDVYKRTFNNRSTKDLIRQFKSFILGSTFILFVSFYSCISVRINDVNASYNTWVSKIVRGDRDKVSYYTDVMAYASFGGTTISFIQGLILDSLRKKMPKGEAPKAMFLVPAMLVWCTAVTAISIPFYIDSEYSIIILVVVYSVLKPSFYSMISNYNSLVVPVEIYGMASGLADAIPGIAALTSFLYMMWVVHAGSYMPVTTYHIITSLLTFSLPIKIIWDLKHCQSEAPEHKPLDHPILRSTSL